MSILVRNSKRLQLDSSFPLVILEQLSVLCHPPRPRSRFSPSPPCQRTQQNGCCSFGRCSPIPQHESMRARKLSHVTNDPQEQIVGLGHGGWKTAGPLVGHDHLRLGFDASRRETRNQDPEKRKQGQRVKLSSERPGHNGTREGRTVSWVCSCPGSLIAR